MRFDLKSPLIPANARTQIEERRRQSSEIAFCHLGPGIRRDERLNP